MTSAQEAVAFAATTPKQQQAWISYMKALAAVTIRNANRAPTPTKQAGFIDIVVVLIFAIGSATFSHFITKSETAVACNKHGKVVMLEKTYTCAEVTKTALSMNAWK